MNSMDRRKFLSGTFKAGGVAVFGSAFINSVSKADPYDDIHPSTDGDTILVKNKEELLNAIRNVTPGDEIVISAGNYEDVQAEIGIKATEKSPIFIVLQPNTVPSLPVQLSFTSPDHIL